MIALTGWTTVAVPKDLRDKIRELSTKEGKPYWQVLEEAVAAMYAQRSRPRVKDSLPVVDKLAWYLVKFGTSLGSLKESPTTQNLARFENTVVQISERMRLTSHSTISLLLKLARDYVIASDAERRKMKTSLNAAAKIYVEDLLLSASRLEETEPVEEEEV